MTLFFTLVPILHESERQLESTKIYIDYFWLMKFPGSISLTGETYIIHL